MDRDGINYGKLDPRNQDDEIPEIYRCHFCDEIITEDEAHFEIVKALNYITKKIVEKLMPLCESCAMDYKNSDIYIKKINT